MYFNILYITNLVNFFYIGVFHPQILSVHLPFCLLFWFWAIGLSLGLNLDSSGVTPGWVWGSYVVKGDWTRSAGAKEPNLLYNLSGPANLLLVFYYTTTQKQFNPNNFHHLLTITVSKLNQDTLIISLIHLIFMSQTCSMWSWEDKILSENRRCFHNIVMDRKITLKPVVYFDAVSTKGDTWYFMVSKVLNKWKNIVTKKDEVFFFNLLFLF